MATHRNILLGLALVATVAASLFDFGSTEDAPSHSPSQARAATVIRAPIATDKVSPKPPAEIFAQARFEAADGDAFAPRSWQPPPPKPVVQKMPEPKAPPLPFRYLGKVMENGIVTAFIAQDARTYLAHTGDTVLDYRVEEITPTQMTLVFLPLNEKQTLSFGSTN